MFLQVGRLLVEGDGGGQGRLLELGSRDDYGGNLVGVGDGFFGGFATDVAFFGRHSGREEGADREGLGEEDAVPCTSRYISAGLFVEVESVAR